MRMSPGLPDAIRTLIDPDSIGEAFSDYVYASYNASYVNLIEAILLEWLSMNSRQNEDSERQYRAYEQFVEDIVDDSLIIPSVYLVIRSEGCEEREVSPSITSRAESLKSELAHVVFQSGILREVSESISVDLSRGDNSLIMDRLPRIVAVIQKEYDSKWMTKVIQANREVFVQSSSKLTSDLIRQYTPELLADLELERQEYQVKVQAGMLQIKEGVLETRNKAYSEMLQSRVKKPKDPSEGRPISSRDEAMEIAGENVLRLKLLSDDLKKDRSFVKSLIAKKGEVISPLREEYGDDEELVLLALKSYNDALLHSSLRLRNSVDFAIKAIKIRGAAYRMFPDSVRENEDVCGAAVRKSKGNFRHLPVQVQELDVIRSLVGLEPMIKDVSEAEKLLRKDGSKFHSLSRELRRNPELIVLAAKEHPLILNSLDVNVCTVELCVSLLKWELRDFECLPKALQEDEQFLRRLIQQVPDVVTQLSPDLQKKLG